MRHQINEEFSFEMKEGELSDIKIYNSLDIKLWHFTNIRHSATVELAKRAIEHFLSDMPKRWLAAAKIGREEYLKATMIVQCRKHEFIYEQVGSECMHWCKNCKKLFRDI